MSQVKDITSAVIPYSSMTENIFAGVHFLIGLFGAIFVTTVLVASVYSMSSKGMMLYVSLMIADLCFCLSVVVMGSIDLFHGGYSLGPTFCAFDAVVIMTSCCASIMSLLALALERYYATIYMQLISARKLTYIVIFIWCFSLTFGLLPVVAGNASETFALEPGKLVCVISWWKTDMITTVMIYMTLLVLSGASIFLIFSYSKIVLSFMKVKQAVSKFSSTNSSLEKGKSGSFLGNISDIERNLLLKAVGITTAFLTFWSPYMVLCLISIMTGKPVNNWFDILCSLFALANSAMSPIILYIFDERIKNNVHRLLL